MAAAAGATTVSPATSQVASESGIDSTVSGGYGLGALPVPAAAAMVQAAFAGAAQGGATRHSLAAMVAALLRTLGCGVAGQAGGVDVGADCRLASGAAQREGKKAKNHKKKKKDKVSHETPGVVATPELSQAAGGHGKTEEFDLFTECDGESVCTFDYFESGFTVGLPAAVSKPSPCGGVLEPEPEGSHPPQGPPGEVLGGGGGETGALNAGQSKAQAGKGPGGDPLGSGGGDPGDLDEVFRLWGQVQRANLLVPSEVSQAKQDTEMLLRIVSSRLSPASFDGTLLERWSEVKAVWGEDFALRCASSGSSSVSSASS